MMTRSCVLGLVAMMLAAPCIAKDEASPKPSAPYDTSTAWEAMKKLVGEWEGTGGPPNGPKPTARYRLTAGATVLEEVLFVGTPQEMTTMYYPEKQALVLRHYCTMGNQPEMKFEPV